METRFKVGELVNFTFDGVVPRLGVVTAIESSGYYQVLFEHNRYWVPPYHISQIKKNIV